MGKKSKDDSDSDSEYSDRENDTDTDDEKPVTGFVKSQPKAKLPKSKPSVKSKTPIEDSSVEPTATVDEEKKPPKVYDAEDNDKTVFVANVPIKTLKTKLMKTFQHYGPIKTIRLRSQTGEKVYNKLDRKRSGSLNAYIVFEDVKSAEKSLAMNNQEYDGNRLRVNMAGEKRSFEKTKGTVFVGNLPFDTTDNDLYEHFGKIGAVEYVRRIPKKGFAFVCFEKGFALSKALKLSGTMLKNRKINVEKWTSQQKMAKKNMKKGKVKSAKAPKTNMEQNARSNNPVYQKVKATARPQEERSWKAKKDMRSQAEARSNNAKKDALKKSGYSGFKSANKKTKKKVNKYSQSEKTKKLIANKLKAVVNKGKGSK